MSDKFNDSIFHFSENPDSQLINFTEPSGLLYLMIRHSIFTKFSYVERFTRSCAR